MRYLTIIPFFSFLLTLPLKVEALPPLYEAEVDVPDQGSQARTEGMSTAMAAVLLKVSGSGSVADNPTLAEGMQQPAHFVQQYSYRREEKDGRVLLHVRFDPRSIDVLLQQSGVNVWGNARPSTLIWLGVEDGGKRVLVGANDRGLVRELVEREAARRALPVKLPVLDSSDLEKVHPADVWGEFLETIKSASERYAPHAVLVGRVYPVSAGHWESRWSLDYRGEVVRWEFQSAAVAPLIAEAIDRVTDYLVSRFTQSYTNGSGEVVMRVEGVRNLKDYRRVINYLKSTHGVKQVVAETMSPMTARIRIVAEGGIDSVLQTIAIGKTLSKVSQPFPPSVSERLQGGQNADRSGGGNGMKNNSSTDSSSETPESSDEGESPQPELVYRLLP